MRGRKLNCVGAKERCSFFYFISCNYLDYLSLYIVSGNLSSKNRTFEFFAVPSKFLKFFLHKINKHNKILQIHCIKHDYSWIILIFHENEFFHHFDIKFRLLRNFLIMRGLNPNCVGESWSLLNCLQFDIFMLMIHHF